MPMSPWAITPELEAEARRQQREADDAGLDQHIARMWAMKAPHIGKPLILDPNHPDYDETLVDI